jgi:SRSO17 transposase
MVVGSVKTPTIIGSLQELSPIRLELVSQLNFEPLWDQLVATYHFLGYRKLLGRRLKYLAFVDEQPVAALSWSAPALKLRVRDRFIGWSEEQRRCHLHHIANNSRFIVFPWVKVNNLASHVLSINIRRLNTDWMHRFENRLWLLETFVDPRNFHGTCYKAANWIRLGATGGFGKQGAGYIHHGNPKEVYVYVLDSNFRETIGCRSQPFDPVCRPPQSLQKVEALKMILRHGNWHPELVPCMDLTEEDLEPLAEELAAFHEQFHHCFGRIEHRSLGLAYLSGLLSNSPAKSVEPIALEFLGQQQVRSLQRFMQIYLWNHGAMELAHQKMLTQEIGAEGGMINIDSSEFVKKGRESVGVARQYCGRLGKVDNCQSGVFIGYASYKGYGLLSAQLYLPEIWFSEAYSTRRTKTGVPKDLRFQTKTQIGLQLIEKIREANSFPAKWIGCDATFGSDPDFLRSLPRDLHYFASVHSNALVFAEKPKIVTPEYKGKGRPSRKPCLAPGEAPPQTVEQLALQTSQPWQKVRLAEGAKGPIIADVLCLRVYPSCQGLPEDDPLWLFVRRISDGQMKYAFSNAPEDIPFSDLCEAATLRWPIEQCFQDGKSHVGMDHYEHRSWTAWHRHMIYVFLALYFLHRLRVRFKKNSCPDGAPSVQANGTGAAHAISR